MNLPIFALLLSASAATGVCQDAFSATEEITTDPVDEPGPKQPILGAGYHVGNFVGPLAFDLIVRPVSHLTLDLQAGTETLSRRRWGLAPQVQWEFLKRPHTPYLGVLFRYERYSLDGQHDHSTGGGATAGWQWRWQSGLGLLVGIGVLYRTAIDLQTPSGGFYSAGGWGGTYELGLRYFFL